MHCHLIQQVSDLIGQGMPRLPAFPLNKFTPIPCIHITKPNSHKSCKGLQLTAKMEAGKADPLLLRGKKCSSNCSSPVLQLKQRDTPFKHSTTSWDKIIRSLSVCGQLAKWKRKPLVFIVTRPFLTTSHFLDSLKWVMCAFLKHLRGRAGNLGAPHTHQCHSPLSGMCKFASPWSSLLYIWHVLGGNVLASQELTQGRAGTSIWPSLSEKEQGRWVLKLPRSSTPKMALLGTTLVGMFNPSRSKSVLMVTFFIFFIFCHLTLGCFLVLFRKCHLSYTHYGPSKFLHYVYAQALSHIHTMSSPF